jgi:hypothetical protein
MFQTPSRLVRSRDAVMSRMEWRLEDNGSALAWVELKNKRLTPARIERTTLWTGITRSTTEPRGHFMKSVVMLYMFVRCRTGCTRQRHSVKLAASVTGEVRDVSLSTWRPATTSLPRHSLAEGSERQNLCCGQWLRALAYYNECFAQTNSRLRLVI